MAELSRITLDMEVCHGKPCVRQMRWPVEVVLDLVGSGMTMDEIIADHAELEREDIVACLHYARLLLSGEAIVHSATQEHCYLELSQEGLIRLPSAS